MDATITFSTETVKELTYRLRLAWRAGQRWLIKQLSDGQEVYIIAGRLGVSTTTIYTWRDDFLVKCWANLVRGRSPNRSAKLTSTQRKRLKELVLNGLEEAGYETGSWNSALMQGLIRREFGKSYKVHYLSTLLKNLDFSYRLQQKNLEVGAR